MKNTIMMLVVLALVLFAGFGCEKTTEIEKNELTVTVMGQNIPESGVLSLETGVYTLAVQGDSVVNIKVNQFDFYEDGQSALFRNEMQTDHLGHPFIIFPQCERINFQIFVTFADDTRRMVVFDVLHQGE